MAATLKAYCIVGPVSPWDKKHRDAIELDHAMQTIAITPGDAWRKECRMAENHFDAGELSHHIQYLHDRGYRLREVELKLMEEKNDE